jgi:Fe-S cluster assembly scaffold protein SufB
MMDDHSSSHAYPYNDISGEHGSLNYEATVSKISDDQLFYLQARGLSEDDAKLLIVNGFCESIVKELNVEYSVEMTRLIRMILEDGKAIAEVPREEKPKVKS